MNKNAKKKSLYFLTLLAFLFLPIVSYAQVFPSDAISLTKNQGYVAGVGTGTDVINILSSGEYTILASEIVLWDLTPPTNSYKIARLMCGGSGGIYLQDVRIDNRAGFNTENKYSNIQGNWYCNNTVDLVLLRGAPATDNINAGLILTYVPRDIANTDDPRLMPVQMTDFYENLNIILEAGIFWVQILAIAWFFLVVVLYRYIWRYLGAYKFFRF